MIIALMQSHNERVDVDLVTLREELAGLKREVQVIKRALKHKIARYEIGQIKKGREIDSILDLKDLN